MHQATDHDRASHIELILRQVETLPTLSPIATRLLEIAGADDADLDRIVEIIESDPALSARMLGLCRRSDKGLGDRIATVRRAVVMLGLEAVQAAALSVAVYDVIEQSSWGATPRAEDRSTLPALGGAAFDREGFWRYSVAVASASELIAEAHPLLMVAPEEAFAAGLLHGIGKLVLDLILPRSYARVVGLAERRQCLSSEVEAQLLGVDHHTAGKRLAEHWGLPYAIQDTIWLAGQPPSSVPDLPHRNLIATVSVARALCRHLHLGWSGDFGHPEPLDGARGICPLHGFDSERTEACVPRLHDEVLRRCKVLGLGDHSASDLLLQSVVAANRKLGRLSAMFEQRARSAQRQSRILTAVTQFHASWRPGRGVVDTLGEVARSASEFFGGGFVATVHQPRDGGVWQLCQFGPDGRLIRSCGVEPPASGPERAGADGGCASLARLCGRGEITVGAISLLPWLTDYLLDCGDLRNIQVLPLTLGESADVALAPSVVLLHEPPAKAVAGDPALLRALTATWAAAVVATAQHEGARRLGERLASANRTLSETQTRLSEAQSLARLGEMAAGAAHEMNNPLTIISGRAQLLVARLQDPADRSLGAGIIEAARDLSDLITSLRLVVDPPSPAFRPVTVARLMAEAITRAGARVDLGQRVNLSIAVGPGSASEPVLDANLFATAVAEVIINAAEASQSAPIDIRVQTAGTDSRLEIIVSDQGPGMSTKALQHAFDPFFSEKPAGRRTGLGLTRARALVELHQGEIAIESRVGAGATVTIRVPLTPGSEESPALQAA